MHLCKKTPKNKTQTFSVKYFFSDIWIFIAKRFKFSCEYSFKYLLYFEKINYLSFSVHNTLDFHFVWKFHLDLQLHLILKKTNAISQITRFTQSDTHFPSCFLLVHWLHSPPIPRSPSFPTFCFYRKCICTAVLIKHIYLDFTSITLAQKFY